MSISWNSYLGPVIICKNGEIDRSVKKTICPKCKIEISTNFCSQCGSKPEIREYSSIDRSVNMSQVMEKLHNDLYFVKSNCLNDYYIPNRRTDYLPKIDDDEIDIQIDNIVFFDLVGRFIEDFDQEISILQKAYGKENVTINFRLLRFAN